MFFTIVSPMFLSFSPHLSRPVLFSGQHGLAVRDQSAVSNRVLPRFGQQTQSTQPPKTLWQKIKAGVKTVWNWICNTLKRFWNWLTGHKEKPSAEAKSSSEPLVDKALPGAPVIGDLPQHFQQSAISGNSAQYIVYNCTTCSLKTLMGFGYAPSDVRITGLKDNLEAFLRGIEKNGLTVEQEKAMHDHMKDGARFGEVAYAGCSKWDDFIGRLKSKDIGLLYNKSAFSFNQLGAMAFLAQYGFQTRFYAWQKNQEPANKLRAIAEVMNALRAEKPVVVGDVAGQHQYLFAMRDEQLYVSDPLKAQWALVDPQKGWEVSQFFAQCYQAILMGQLGELPEFPEANFLIVDTVHSKA